MILELLLLILFFSICGIIFAKDSRFNKEFTIYQLVGSTPYLQREAIFNNWKHFQ